MKEYKLFIGGKWETGGSTRIIKSPYDQRTVGKVHEAGNAHIEEALKTSQAAFRQMRLLPAYKRAEALRKITEGIKDRNEELAETICLEAGKPIIGPIVVSSRRGSPILCRPTWVTSFSVKDFTMCS